MGAGHLTGVRSQEGSLHVCSLFLLRGTKLRLVPDAQRGGGEWFLGSAEACLEAPSCHQHVRACTGSDQMIATWWATLDLHPDSWVQGSHPVSSVTHRQVSKEDQSQDQTGEGSLESSTPHNPAMCWARGHPSTHTLASLCPGTS